MTTQARVLVVDDDPVIARSFDRVLCAKGYAVISARDGTEALKKLASEDYDAVFTDIKMPGMDGLEVATRILATQPWLPVVIVTGHGTPSSEAYARKIGVAGFLHKPLSPETIEHSARDALLSNVPKLAALAGMMAAAPAAPAPAPQATASPAAGAGRFAQNVALFLAAPFIGLAYAVAFPFVGLVLLARVGYRAVVGRNKR